MLHITEEGVHSLIAFIQNAVTVKVPTSRTIWQTRYFGNYLKNVTIKQHQELYIVFNCVIPSS
jgi:hypothetical protein